MNETGWVPKRRGVLDHLESGRLTLLEYGAYDVMILKAGKATGIWIGSARALAANCGAGDITERQARHILESLESKGYIKRFSKPRSRRNYPIIIDKCQATSGAYRGMRLNASLTNDWRNPAYESCLGQGAQEGPQQGAQQGAQNAPIQEEILENRKGRKPCAPANAPSQEGVALAALLLDRIIQNNPGTIVKPSEAVRWAREADLMMRCDGRTEAQIRELIEWCQRDSFWRTIILSMTKLRDKFDQLTAKKNANGKGVFSHAQQRTQNNLRAAGFV